MKYHGNYCGPNWSDGKQQPSVVGTVMPIDEFDNTCRLHDDVYALSGDTEAADYAFYHANIGVGLKRSAAAMVVGAQGIVRTYDKLIQSSITPLLYHLNMPKTKTNKTVKQSLRTAMPSKALAVANPGRQVTVSTVPAAYGFSLRMKQPVVNRTGNTATIIGADYAGSVNATANGLYQPASSILLNPIYFNSSMLGSLARAYEKFRFRKASVQYVPSVPTSTQGQVIMTSTRTVKEPFIASSSPTFLSRALSQGNAVAMPVWKDEVITVDCSTEWMVVDALIDSDLDDSIQEEIQVYATCDSTVVTGILILHYEIEFKDPLYTYHPTAIPSPVGNGSVMTCSDVNAVNALNDAIRVTQSGIDTLTLGQGAIYRCVFNNAQSTLPTGIPSWDLWAVAGVSRATSVNTSTQTTVNISGASGSVFYALEWGNLLTLYASYEGAAAGLMADVLCFRSATTTRGIYKFLVHAVRIGTALRVSTQ